MWNLYARQAKYLHWPFNSLLLVLDSVEFGGYSDEPGLVQVDEVLAALKENPRDDDNVPALQLKVAQGNAKLKSAFYNQI